MYANLSSIRAAIALAPMQPSQPIDGENLPFAEEDETKDLAPWDNDWVDIGGES